MNTARVVIGQSNPAWGDIPYTLQPGLCGQEGDYIHVTPDYITSRDPDIGMTVWIFTFFESYIQTIGSKALLFVLNRGIFSHI